MSVTFWQLLVYAGGMAALWAVPGPVWVALTARALSGGMAAAWPLAVGVAIGDTIWLLAAIFGLSWVEGTLGEVLTYLRWLAALIFLFMGISLLRAPAGKISADSRLTRPGLWAGLTVGIAVVIGNPKAVIFYLTALPGFFTLSNLTGWDVIAIASVATAVPMIGNLCLAYFLDRARQLLSSPRAMRRMNIFSGILLILVAVAIPFL